MLFHRCDESILEKFHANFVHSCTGHCLHFLIWLLICTEILVLYRPFWLHFRVWIERHPPDSCRLVRFLAIFIRNQWWYQFESPTPPLFGQMRMSNAWDVFVILRDHIRPTDLMIATHSNAHKWNTILGTYFFCRMFCGQCSLFLEGCKCAENGRRTTNYLYAQSGRDVRVHKSMKTKALNGCSAVDVIIATWTCTLIGGLARTWD